MALPGHTPDFWVAVAAAAPVIALAGLVSMPDAAVAGDMLKQATGKREPLGDTIRWGKLLGPQSNWVIIYGVFILITQAVVLIAALWTLLYDSPLFPGIAAISLEIVGLVLLLVAAILQSQVRIQRQRLEKKRTDDTAELDKRRADDEPKKLAEAIASKLRQS